MLKIDSKDHFVSQTYMKHFSSSPRFVFIYRKSEKFIKEVPYCSICFEYGGDICDQFENKFGIKELLKIIEPAWNHFITSVTEKKLIDVHIERSGCVEQISFLEKICCFMAYLRCISPTQHRLMKEQTEGFVNQFLLPKLAEKSNKNWMILQFEI